MALSQNQKVGIGVGVVVLIAAIVVLILWLRSGKDDDNRVDPPGPGPEPKPEPPGPGPVVIGPDPMKPTTTPTKGQYYIVKAGDSDSLICGKAGFSNINDARTTMRDHSLNSWIPQKADNPLTSYNERALDLFFGWEKMVGFESLMWSWKTKRITWGNKNGPIVYVPTDAEVSL
jgi:hypothetical protein